MKHGFYLIIFLYVFSVMLSCTGSRNESNTPEVELLVDTTQLDKQEKEYVQSHLPYFNGKTYLEKFASIADSIGMQNFSAILPELEKTEDILARLYDQTHHPDSIGRDLKDRQFLSELDSLCAEHYYKPGIHLAKDYYYDTRYHLLEFQEYQTLRDIIALPDGQENQEDILQEALLWDNFQEAYERFCEMVVELQYFGGNTGSTLIAENQVILQETRLESLKNTFQSIQDTAYAGNQSVPVEIAARTFRENVNFWYGDSKDSQQQEYLIDASLESYRSHVRLLFQKKKETEAAFDSWLMQRRKMEELFGCSYKKNTWKTITELSEIEMN